MGPYDWADESPEAPWRNTAEEFEAYGDGEEAFSIFCNGFGSRNEFHEWIHALPKDRAEAQLLDRFGR